MSDKTWPVALIETVPGLLWPAIIIGLALYFHDTIRAAVQAIRIRLERGEPIKIWLLELQRLASPTEDRPREAGKIRTGEDASRQTEIEGIKQTTHNLMLVRRFLQTGEASWPR